MDDGHLLHNWHFFDLGYDLDDVLGGLLIVGDLDVLGLALLEFLDFVLDVLDDLLHDWVFLDHFLDVVGYDGCLASHTDGGLSLGWSHFL